MFCSRSFVLTVAILAATPAYAKDWPESVRSGCILKAAQKLPVIPGIQIKSAELTDLDVNIRKALPSSFNGAVGVKFTINAATIDAVLVYICALEPNGEMEVTPLR